MAIERPMGLDPFSNWPQQEESVEIGIVNPESVSVETPDGGVLIDFDPNGGMGGGDDHNQNLADLMEEQDLRGIASELVGAFEADRDSRSDWENTYINGLDLLGLKNEDRTEPWDGACGVFHPVLTEAVIRFQAPELSDYGKNDRISLRNRKNAVFSAFSRFCFQKSLLRPEYGSALLNVCAC